MNEKLKRLKKKLEEAIISLEVFAEALELKYEVKVKLPWT